MELSQENEVQHKAVIKIQRVEQFTIWFTAYLYFNNFARYKPKKWFTNSGNSRVPCRPGVSKLWPAAKYTLHPALVNKDWLELSHGRFFRHCLWQSLCYKVAEMNSFNRDCIVHKAIYNIYYVSFCRKSLPLFFIGQERKYLGPKPFLATAFTLYIWTSTCVCRHLLFVAKVTDVQCPGYFCRTGSECYLWTGLAQHYYVKADQIATSPKSQ